MEFKELGKSGVNVPVLGLGTWALWGSRTRIPRTDDHAVQAIRLGLQLGMRFIDTAEMYDGGHSEEIVATALKSERDKAFIATKVSPQHFSEKDVVKSCEASLKRLEIDCIDLYQLHWPSSSIPITQTMKGMERLVSEGKIRYIGVSNFSVKQTREAQEALSKNEVVSNQVEYSLVDRSIEDDLLSYAQKEHITIIAYSPLARGEIARGRGDQKWKILDEIASKYQKTRGQIALSWLVTHELVVAIPKAAKLEHVRENVGAVGWRMSPEDHHALSSAFPQ